MRKLETEGVRYGILTPVIPMGGGVKFKLGPFFNIALEGAYRKTFTDYLDDVSTTHVDNDELYATDPLAATMADRRPEIGLATVDAGFRRGNPDKKDGYFIMNVKIEYFLSPLGLFSNYKKGFNKRKRSKNKNTYRRKRR